MNLVVETRKHDQLFPLRQLKTAGSTSSHKRDGIGCLLRLSNFLRLLNAPVLSSSAYGLRVLFLEIACVSRG
jgi:hypothetical protein